MVPPRRLGHVPTKGNDKRTFRMADKPWREFVAACDRAGLTPQDALRLFALWYARTPGVTLRRPHDGRSDDNPS